VEIIIPSVTAFADTLQTNITTEVVEITIT
jgi:hypothetical protein